jgi:hypothetical protein
MKFSTNALIQILGTVGHFVNLASPVVSPSGQKWVAVGLGAIQGIAGLLSHFSNPDGTSAQTAYVPKVG